MMIGDVRNGAPFIEDLQHSPIGVQLLINSYAKKATEKQGTKAVGPELQIRFVHLSIMLERKGCKGRG